MQDAFGGILNIGIVVVFLVIVSGILAFIVSYTKAFKMKNSIITIVEQYDGIGCFTDTSACNNKINESAEKNRYDPSVNISCPNDYKSVSNLFCYKELKLNASEYSYKIITQVDINIPIINKMMGFSFFQVRGDTRVVYRPE